MSEAKTPAGQIRSEVHGRVFKIIIDNAAKKNAFSPEMMAQMSDALRFCPDPDLQRRAEQHVAARGGPRFFERPGWRNELLNVVAVRHTAGTRERTDSPQPSSLRGTLVHQSAELWFLLFGFALPLKRQLRRGDLSNGTRYRPPTCGA